MPTLWDKLNDFQALVAKVQARAPDPRDRQLLGQMLQQIKASQAVAQEKLPALLDNIKNQAEDFHRKFAAAKQELGQATQKAEALAEQAAQREALEKQLLLPKVKVPPVAAIDPQLGKQLRSELLAKIDQAGKAQDGQRVVHGEIWESWDGFGSRAEANRPPSAAPSQPAAARPAKPAPAPTPAEPPRQPAPLVLPSPAPPAAERDLNASVWDGMSRMEEPTTPAAALPEPSPAQPPEPTTAPSRKPKPRKDADEDIWEGLSRMGD